MEEHGRVLAERIGEPRYNPGAQLTVGATRQVIVDRDGDRARRRGIDAWRTFTAHINHHFWRTGEKAPRDPSFGGDAAAAMAANALVVGSPAQVAESYLELAEVGGVDYLLGSFFWGDLDAAEAMASFELFVTEVIPAVERAVAT
jgi:alkanesulfonate monooxygenase SsuD/methylene tetrahydromethanopterin reductase-like flavin-dependent oxidoreductase (luciferase family)